MRAWGEGTIQELPNGKYRGAISLGKKRIFGPTVERRENALPALRAKIRAMEEGKEPAEEPPLSICVRRRIEVMRSRSYSPTTIDLWEATLKRIEGDPLGDLPPSDIEAFHLQSWTDRQKGAARTVRNYLNNVRAVLRQYGREIPISTRVSDSAVMPPKAQDSRQEVLSPQEEEQLLALKMTEQQRVMVLLALKMGLRRSEIAGLAHEDYEDGGVLIRSAVVRAKGIVAIKDTKTDSSRAWIPLCPELEGVIGRGQGFVIKSTNKKRNPALPASPSVLDDRWKSLVKGTKLARFTLHDLRATYAMRLLESGVDVRTAAEMLRHSPTMLLSIYSRSRKDLKREAMKRVAAKSVAETVAEAGLG